MSQLALLDVDPHVRRENDFYETEPWMTRALLRRVPITGSVLEPCAGRGAIAKVLADRALVFTNEPYPQAGCDFRPTWQLDATMACSWKRFKRVDWVVSNFPYDLADVLVPLALAHATIGVATILRLSWQEPTDARGEFLAAHPPTTITMPRHDFRGNGKTDSVTSAWFIWLAEGGLQRYGYLRNAVVCKRERDEWLAGEAATCVCEQGSICVAHRCAATHHKVALEF